MYNSHGLDVTKLLEHQTETGTVSTFPDTEAVAGDEFLELPCDILVPAAIEGVIHTGNADRIKAGVIAEAANHPTTPAASVMLGERGVILLPDILANAGGVVASYFEWAQDIQRFRWQPERVHDELSTIMRQATTEVLELAQRDGLTLREAAFVIGVGRVAHTIQLRGFV